MLSRFSIELLDHFVAADAGPTFLNDQSLILIGDGLKIRDNVLHFTV